MVREVSPDLHLITPELHQVSPDSFFSTKWENAKCSSIFLSSKSFARIGNFARRLFSLRIAKRHILEFRLKKKDFGGRRYTSMHCAVWSRSCPFKDWVSSDKSMTATHLADTSNIWHIVGPDEVLLMARHSPSTTPLTLNELMNQRLIRGSSGRNAFLSHSFRGGTFVSGGRVSWESSGWFLHGHSAQFVKNVKGSCKLNHGAL